MDKREITAFLTLISTNYSKDVDKNLVDLWFNFFRDFDERIFQQALMRIIKSSSYFPKINEVIDAYVQVQNEQRNQANERARVEQKRLIARQSDCYLCSNTGFCVYQRGDYQFATRCICAHGSDLNKFSKAQIEKDYSPELSDNYTPGELTKIKNGENPFWLPTIKDILGKDFAVYEAQKKADKLRRVEGNSALTNEQKIKILSEIAGG